MSITRQIALAISALLLTGIAGTLAVESGERRLEAAEVTGWAMLIAIVLLGLITVRKKLSMLPLGSMAPWLTMHWALGAAAVVAFFFHTGSLWPLGMFERLLAALFYLASLTGIIGFVITRTVPRRLTRSGVEVIFERIPATVATLREQAEAIVLENTARSGSATLARHYQESFDWFFRKPRFLVAHLFGLDQAQHWIRHQDTVVRRYLNDLEQSDLERLTRLALDKAAIDRHYTLQGLAKTWLLFHVPLAAAVTLAALWHAILIYVYGR